MKPDVEMVAAHAGIFCRLRKDHEVIMVECESQGRVLETRYFSGRDPAEIVSFVLAENARGRNIFAKTGGSLTKAAEGGRFPFAGTVAHGGKNGPYVIGAPTPEAHVPPPPPRPQSFLKMRGFA